MPTVSVSPVVQESEIQITESEATATQRSVDDEADEEYKRRVAFP